MLKGNEKIISEREGEGLRENGLGLSKEGFLKEEALNYHHEEQDIGEKGGKKGAVLNLGSAQAD